MDHLSFFSGLTFVAFNLSVSKVAAQVGIKSKDLIGLCQEHGLPHITHHNTMLWPKEIDLIHELCAKNAEALHA